MNKSTQPFPLLLWLILALALVVRFRYLLQIEHNVDHAYTIWQAMTTLYQGQFPLAGQGTSVLFANPPLTGYLYLPVFILTRSMLGVYVFIIALNTLAVWMAYRAVSTLIGERLALLAALMMAVNPWVIEYSRTSWVQSLLPFFVCAIAWLLWPVLRGLSARPARRVMLAIAMVTVFAHTYLLSFFMILPVAVLMLVFRQRLNWRAVAVGVAGFAVVGTLYGIGLFQQIDVVQQRVSDFGGAPSTLRIDSLQHAARLVTGADYEIARGQEAPADDMLIRHEWTQPFIWVLNGFLVIGVIAACVDVVRQTPRRDSAVIALLWFALPIAAMSYTGNPIHPFYLFFSVPAGYALVLWGFTALPSAWQGRGMLAFAVMLLPFSALMLTNSARYYQETAAHPSAHGFTALSMEYALQVGDVIREHHPPNGVIFANADGWIFNSYAAQLFPAVWDVRIPNFAILPRQGGMILSMQANVPPLPIGAERVGILPMRDEVTIYADRLPPVATLNLADALPQSVLLDIPSEQGIRLHRYQIIQSDEEWTLITVWVMDGDNSSIHDWIIQPFIHGFDAQGERILNISGEGVMGYMWNRGDVHVHQTSFSIDPTNQPVSFSVGQFDSLKSIGLTFILPDGEFIGVVTIMVEP